jgi:hypothetical protein
VRARLDAAVPGRGGLAERLEAWNVSQQVPPEALLPAFEALVDNDKPWSAYNAYLGDLKQCTRGSTLRFPGAAASRSGSRPGTT